MSNKGSKLFAYRDYLCVRPFQPNAMARDWHNLSLWSLPIVMNEVMQTVYVRVILFLTSKPPEGVQILQCGFSQPKQEFPLTLV